MAIVRDLAFDENHIDWLQGFTQEEAVQLREKYVINEQTLNASLSRHINYYRFLLIHNYISLSSNALYFIFQANTSNEGVKNLFDSLFQGMHTSDAIGYGIGIPTAAANASLYSLMFSSHKKAVEGTLRFIHDPSYESRMATFINTAKDDPMHASKLACKKIFDECVLTISYYTSAVTEIIEIHHLIPVNLQLTATLLVLHFCRSYLEQFMTKDFHAGEAFWTNKPNYPWLLGEIKRGNIATPLQIFLQGIISTTLIRTHPYHWNVAAKAEKTLGWWFPKPLVATAITIQSLCVFYPATYLRYLGDSIKINDLLRQKLNTNESMQRLLRAYATELQINLTDATPQQHEELAIAVISLEKNLIKDKIQLDFQRFIREEPYLAIPLLFRTAIGGYFGAHIIAPLLEYAIEQTILTTTIGTILGAGLFGGLLYKAEYNRVLDKLILNELEAELTIDAKKVINYENTWRTTLLKFAATTLNVGNAISQAISVMGLESRELSRTHMTGNSAAIVTVTSATVATESAINRMIFNAPKATDTILSLFARPVKSVTNVISSLFHQPSAQHTPDDIIIQIESPTTVNNR